jgi:hypothetical protein
MAAGLLGLVLTAGPGAAQHHDHEHTPAGAVAFGWGAQVIPLLTHATPAVHDEPLTEFYFTQPNLMGHVGVWSGRLELRGALNLEGLTLRRGELTPGAWGEGYVDRRHPHTYVHELMVVARAVELPSGLGAASLAFGKGFAPYGTDDPMVRPFVNFPVNHHHAQILERLVGIAALRIGPVIAEAGLFSGDEPQSPSHFVTPGRFGDSWAVRGTLLPLAGLEASASYAHVSSPEFTAGSGIDHRQHSAALRYEVLGGRGDSGYALVEWARLQRYILDEPYHAFTSWLAEAATRRGATELALRYERTVRPEEKRSADPFRVVVPHHDVHVLAATRWDIVTASAGRRLALTDRFVVRPFAEVAHARVTETLGSVLFEPAAWYGSDRLWNLSLGVRLEAGGLHGRMGRYGAAEPVAAGPMHGAHAPPPADRHH